ncbi:MAG TPA: CPBP family intramembrane glutamic endopeptidase [Polyangiaceae bacterium]|jgi:membrane protease YdiL (CAAX protease family)|nr:CPBP family intramembrane glutamic endopeptidase [Polyangiaceae bacterium]
MSSAGRHPSRIATIARLLAVSVAWAVTFRLLSAYGVDLLPLSVAHELTLEDYLALVQLVTLAVGLALSFVVLAEPRRDLALVRPRTTPVVYAMVLTPAIFVVATGTAFAIAKPTLLAELMHGGVAAVQKNTGEFGRELTQSPAWLSFVWGALISPVSEELFFRGAFFTLSLEAVTSLRVPEKLRGTVTTILVATVFGFLHHDMPGGLGIVRFASALGLGLACGFARQLSGSVLPPMLIHVAFNALSLATARRLVVSDTFPMKSGVPTLMALIAAITTWGVALHFLLVRRGSRQSL